MLAPIWGFFFARMSAYILGYKSKTTQVFTDAGERVPVTYINTSPCFLINLKWPQRDGYMALTFGFGQTKNIRKPQMGQINKAGIKTPLRFFSEFRPNDDTTKIIEENGKKGVDMAGVKLFIGDEVKPTLFFKKGDMLTVSGISKGKGFQGVVKRHAFKGGPRTHGQSDRERAPGAIGMTTTPGRIFKGKRMAGRMGQERITITNLEVMEVTETAIVLKGLVPGSKKGMIEVKKSK